MYTKEKFIESRMRKGASREDATKAYTEAMRGADAARNGGRGAPKTGDHDCVSQVGRRIFWSQAKCADMGVDYLRPSEAISPEEIKAQMGAFELATGAPEHCNTIVPATVVSYVTRGGAAGAASTCGDQRVHRKPPPLRALQSPG
jgi:hypothetical protein